MSDKPDDTTREEPPTTDMPYRELALLQHDVGEWAEQNFGDADAIRRNINERGKRGGPGADIGAMFTAMGAAEECGELIHSVLKRAQGIRLADEDVGPQAEQDAVGDIIIYLADFCHRRGYNINECVREAWGEEVSDREWDSETRPASQSGDGGTDA